MKWAALLLVSLLGFDGEKPYVEVKNSHGGPVDEFDMTRYRYEKAGIEVRISGVCSSACAIFTGMEKVCVEPGSVFLFHQATKPAGTHIVLGRMAPGMREFFESFGQPMPSNRSGEFLVLEADEAIENRWIKSCRA